MYPFKKAGVKIERLKGDRFVTGQRFHFIHKSGASSRYGEELQEIKKILDFLIFYRLEIRSFLGQYASHKNHEQMATLKGKRALYGRDWKSKKYWNFGSH